MEYIKLKDLFTIKKGKKVEQINEKSEDSIRYIQIDDLRNNNNIKYCNNDSKYVIANKHDIIIAWDGANAGTVGYGLEGAIGSTLAILRKSTDEFISEFCGLFLKSKFDYLRDKCTGATIPHISKVSLEELKLPKFTLENQMKIVEVIKLSQELIDKRKAQIEALDELVKSQFIGMFGGEKYPLVKAEEVCEYITKGTTPKSNEIIDEFNEELIPYLKVYNLSFDGSMLFNDKPQYVTLEIHNKLLARSKVYPNDVLMNIVGPPLGKFALVPNTFSEWNINQAMAIFRATKKISPIYLLHALKQPSVLKPFIDSAVGVRQQNLSLLQCRNLQIPLPPLELQNQFADFVKQVDKLKFEMEKSLKELEDNFNSLMQKAFNGQLFNK